MHKNIIVLGASGMLGHKVFEVLSKGTDFNVLGTVTNKSSFNECLPKSLDSKIVENIFADKIETVYELIELKKPDVVINCIGAIKQKKEEKDVVDNIILNALFPHQVANICKKNNIKFITIATDCVFDGTKGNYIEEDLPTCHDIYGMSKYLGEVNNGSALTLRTSIIGHELKAKVSLLDWFLEQNGNSVKGYKNAIFSGFTTLEFAKFLSEKIIPYKNLVGLYQISTDPISKYDLLNVVSRVYGKMVEIIPDESVKINRSLNSDVLKKMICYQPPTWDRLITEMHADYLVSEFYRNKS